MYSVASLKAKMCAEPDCFFLLTVYVGHSKSSPEDATDKIKKPADRAEISEAIMYSVQMARWLSSVSANLCQPAYSGSIPLAVSVVI